MFCRGVLVINSLDQAQRRACKMPSHDRNRTPELLIVPAVTSPLSDGVVVNPLYAQLIYERSSMLPASNTIDYKNFGIPLGWVPAIDHPEQFRER